MFLFGGGLIASFLNLSQFMIIGRTSALTVRRPSTRKTVTCTDARQFNIVSNVKMLVILALGWHSESKVFSVLDVVGVGLALIGAWQYARISK